MMLKNIPPLIDTDHIVSTSKELSRTNNDDIWKTQEQKQRFIRSSNPLLVTVLLIFLLQIWDPVGKFQNPFPNNSEPRRDLYREVKYDTCSVYFHIQIIKANCLSMCWFMKLKAQVSYPSNAKNRSYTPQAVVYCWFRFGVDKTSCFKRRHQC